MDPEELYKQYVAMGEKLKGESQRIDHMDEAVKQRRLEQAQRYEQDMARMRSWPASQPEPQSPMSVAQQQIADAFAKHGWDMNDPRGIAFAKQARAQALKQMGIKERPGETYDAKPSIADLYRQQLEHEVRHEAAKRAQSERTVGSFVLAGQEMAKYGNTTPATQVMLNEQMKRANPYPVPEEDQYPESPWGSNNPLSRMAGTDRYR